jgi:hypothetical protein
MGRIIIGKTLLGSTDRVIVQQGGRKLPIFHVATQFFHINYIPLYPCTSVLVLDFLGSVCIKIPPDCKSICIAWLRFLSWFSIIPLCIAAFGGFDDDTKIGDVVRTQHAFLGLGVAIALIIALLVTWHGWFNDASYDRSIELLSYLPNTGETKANLRRLIDLHFSEPSAEGALDTLPLYTQLARAELVDDGVETESTTSDFTNNLEMSEERDINNNPDVPTVSEDNI